jgi:hypothetical protein
MEFWKSGLICELEQIYNESMTKDENQNQNQNPNMSDMEAKGTKEPHRIQQGSK